MAKGRDKNYISIWFWLFTMLVMMVPVLNILMILVWAFWGENESRKNYFKAVLIVFFLTVVLVGVLFALDLIPQVLDQLPVVAK